MLNSRRLILAHFWLAFLVFGIALVLGAWQMFIRSPLHTWISDPEWYYRSVTAHGTIMGYLFPTLIAMGFGYAISESSLGQPLIGPRWAWAGFGLVLVGTVTAIIPVSLGRATVLYTFYPPLIGNPFYYIGVVLVVVGSWIWVALMSINLRAWKKANPGRPVPLPMFANVAGSYLWAWTAVGAALELLLQLIPVALGLTSTINVGLARVFFSWTLHAIVYFWLIPTYIAYYTILPRAIGGKIYSDTMMRLAFITFLVVAMPIGIHHIRRPAGRRGLEIRPLHIHSARCASYPDHGLHHLRFGRDRGAPSRRTGLVRLARGAAVEQPDHARFSFFVRDAGFRRGRRPHQHELPTRRDRP